MEPLPDIDPSETQEWLDALDSVLTNEGTERAHYLLERLVEKARRSGAYLPYSATTAYINTIPPGKEERSPGNHALEHRIRSYVRWNSMAMVLRANKNSNVGGHIASFASAATLYDVGYNHFWQATSEDRGGDLVYAQGHSSPGLYAYAFLLGELTEEQLNNFRQEVEGKGLSSYPHPWLMPDFWQFPTVSMGLGPLMAIYQARFMKYLDSRGLVKTRGARFGPSWETGKWTNRSRWGPSRWPRARTWTTLFLSSTATFNASTGRFVAMARLSRNWKLPFVVLAGTSSRSYGVILGSAARKGHQGIATATHDGVRRWRIPDFKSRDGAYVREHFFGKYPELLEMVANMSDDDIWRLNRGGHDPHKVYRCLFGCLKA